MRRIFAACLLVGAAIVFSAPQAGADPEDLLPYCSGRETPMDNNCRQTPLQEATGGTGSGLSPNLPAGLNPLNPAVVG